jgi:hypothetical protein
MITVELFRGRKTGKVSVGNSVDFDYRKFDCFGMRE